jgi:hypothetical protein
VRIAPKLYQLARTINTIEILLSGDPKRIVNRAKNIAIGRGLARSGILNKIWTKI